MQGVLLSCDGGVRGRTFEFLIEFNHPLHVIIMKKFNTLKSVSQTQFNNNNGRGDITGLDLIGA